MTQPKMAKLGTSGHKFVEPLMQQPAITLHLTLAEQSIGHVVRLYKQKTTYKL